MVNENSHNPGMVVIAGRDDTELGRSKTVAGSGHILEGASTAHLATTQRGSVSTRFCQAKSHAHLRRVWSASPGTNLSKGQEVQLPQLAERASSENRQYTQAL